ncbi:MAG: putative DNA-binding domain-containing protein [Nitratireductor sp.]|nr:putative DNA-binding domain-containing protein [Nitratireductor sp.]
MTGFNVGEPYTRSFGAALLDPDIPVPDGVCSPGGGPATKRYAVYRNNVVVGLMEAMRSAFPSLLAVMGEAGFNRVARNFIAVSPPKSPMMQHYGDGFAEFLENFAPVAKSPFLADMARAERAFLSAWHARDADAASIHDIAGVGESDLPDLVFEPHPAARLVESPWPVADLFNRRNGDAEDEIDLGEAQALLFTRPQLSVLVHVLQADQAAFIRELLNGGKLGEAAGQGFGTNPEFDFPLALQIAFSSGAVGAVPKVC